MKTPAERQRELRQRRIDSGQQKRLNIWVNRAAFNALSQAAKEAGINKIEFLNKLLLSLICRDGVTASHSSESMNGQNAPRDTPDSSNRITLKPEHRECQQSPGMPQEHVTPSQTEQQTVSVTSEQALSKSVRKPTVSRKMGNSITLKQSCIPEPNINEPTQGSLF